MNLVLLFPEDFVNGEPCGQSSRVRIEGRRSKYVREVHREMLGDELCVGLLDGAMGRGVIVAMEEDRIELEVVLDRSPPALLPLTLVLALPRPLVLKRVLICATSMGVGRIVLVNARRVEKSYWQSKALEETALREQLLLGLEQARATSLPEVHLRPRFRPFVEDELVHWIGGTEALVADPSGAKPCPRHIGGALTLAIGPEGGWSEYELERLSAVGFAAVHLGERIMRVETAVPALISRLL